MAQLRAKQIKLANEHDLLIGGANGNGTVLSKGTAGQVLKVLTGGALGYEKVAAADTTFDKGATALTATTVEAAIHELAGLAGTGVAGVQTELDAVETAVGLNADGTYTPIAGGEFVGEASVKADLAALDTALSAVKVTADAAATQTDLDALTTAYQNADSALDARLDVIEPALDAAEDAILALEGEHNALEATVGAKTDGTPNFYANGNYIVRGSAEIPEDASDPENVIPAVPAVTPDNHTVAIGKLDAALKSEELLRVAAVGAVQAELDATQAGAGLAVTGAYEAETTSNYINSATTLKGADMLLDAAIKAVRTDLDAVTGGGGGSLTALQTEVDAIESAVGLNTDGTLAAFAAGGKAEGKTTFKAAVEAIDAALTIAEGDIDALDARIDSLGNAFNYVGVLGGSDLNLISFGPGATAGEATDLDGLAAGYKDAGDYYKVSSDGYYKVGEAGTPFFVKANDGLVWNTEGGVDIIDNTNSNVLAGANIAVSGTADTGFTVSLDGVVPVANGGTGKAALEDVTSSSGAITLGAGAVGSVVNGFAIGFDPSQVAFSSLAEVGTPEANKFLRWNAAGTAIEYVTAAQLGATVAVEEDFAPAAAANVSFTLTSAPTGDVAVYMNGVKLKKAGYAVAGSTVTLNDAANGYPYEAGDTLSVSYHTAAA
jgi:hypothetical protein